MMKSRNVGKAGTSLAMNGDIKIRADFCGLFTIGIIFFAVATWLAVGIHLHISSSVSDQPYVTGMSLTLGSCGLLLTCYGLCLRFTCLEVKGDEVRYVGIKGQNCILLQDLSYLTERVGATRTDALYTLLFCGNGGECLLRIPNYPQEFRKADLTDFLRGIVMKKPSVRIDQDVYHRLGVVTDND